MIKSIFVYLLVLLLFTASQAQSSIPRDTTYTLRSTYEKVKKYHPELHAIPVYSNPSDDIEVKKNAVYRRIGGRELVANLFYPRQKDLYPGILMVHGGGWRAGDKSLMTPMAERFAAAGYVVVVPEYRLSLEAQYPAAVYDLKAAIRWMRQNADNLKLDTSQIAILGCSAGGQLATLVGTTNNDSRFEGIENPEFSSQIQAIVDIDGVLAFIHPKSQESTVAAEWIGGGMAEIPEVWKEASALTHVSDQTPPTVFLASKYPRFLAGSEEYTELLRQYGIYTDTRYFPDAPHSFWLLNPWFEPTVAYIIDFFAKTFE